MNRTKSTPGPQEIVLYVEDRTFVGSFPPSLFPRVSCSFGLQRQRLARRVQVTCFQVSCGSEALEVRGWEVLGCPVAKHDARFLALRRNTGEARALLLGERDTYVGFTPYMSPGMHFVMLFSLSGSPSALLGPSSTTLTFLGQSPG